MWVTWVGEACLGVAGYLLLSKGFVRLGLALIALWAALGFDGLAHYSLAPVGAHTLAMNVTIWTEVCESRRASRRCRDSALGHR